VALYCGALPILGHLAAGKRHLTGMALGKPGILKAKWSALPNWYPDQLLA
jgi:hypothetical protein